nr:hypothetical protein OG999_49475 [Streptomyces sp. NBC_00886]
MPTRTLALHADLTGSQKALGQAQEHGALLAVAAHNTRRRCDEELAALGHRTYWDGYFASRAAPLG